MLAGKPSLCQDTWRLLLSGLLGQVQLRPLLLCLLLGLFIVEAEAEVCITVLHRLLNVLGSHPLLTSTEVVI